MYLTHIIHTSSLTDEHFKEVENIMKKMKAMHNLKQIEIKFILNPRPNMYEFIFEGVEDKREVKYGKEKKDNEGNN